MGFNRLSFIALFLIGFFAMEVNAMSFVIQSPAFEEGGSIPSRYTCDGKDISPPLQWAGVPEGTRSLALIVDDPDAPDPAAPRMVWVHWVLYNLPPDIQGLPEAVMALPPGTLEGINDRCPPWRAKRRRVVPGSREATRDTRRAEGAKGDPKGASERGVQSYGRPVCSRNELAMLWRNAG